jgi:chemotaxis protein CheZ
MTPDNYRALGPLVDDLKAALDSGDDAAFRASFEKLRAGVDESYLMPELKRLTASAEAAMKRFRQEARLEVLADHEVPDARRRLAHVVKLTEEAAHRTLDLVEQSTPLVERMQSESGQLLEEWGLHGSRQLAVATFWPERAYETMERVMRDADHLRRYLSQMLLAQGYQDLSGQIIQAVIKLAVELETVLGELAMLAQGEDTRRVRALKLPGSPGADQGMGPQVPGVASRSATVSGQDDIDALLASVANGSS